MPSSHLFDYVRLAVLAVSVLAFAYELAMPLIRFVMLKADQEAVAGRRAAVDRRLSKGEEDLKAVEAEQAKATKRREQLVRRRDSLQMDILRHEKTNFELVHEVGDARPGIRLFSAQIAVRPDFLRAEDRDVPFAREIWKHPNLAHVLASTEPEARRVLQAVFPPQSGLATPVVTAETG
jgi:hypothetical protein